MVTLDFVKIFFLSLETVEVRMILTVILIMQFIPKAIYIILKEHIRDKYDKMHKM